MPKFHPNAPRNRRARSAKLRVTTSDARQQRDAPPKHNPPQPRPRPDAPPDDGQA